MRELAEQNKLFKKEVNKRKQKYKKRKRLKELNSEFKEHKKTKKDAKINVCNYYKTLT